MATQPGQLELHRRWQFAVLAVRWGNSEVRISNEYVLLPICDWYAGVGAPTHYCHKIRFEALVAIPVGVEIPEGGLGTWKSAQDWVHQHGGVLLNPETMMEGYQR